MLFSLMPCLMGKLRETGLEPSGSGRSFIKRSMSPQTVRQAWE